MLCWKEGKQKRSITKSTEGSGGIHISKQISVVSGFDQSGTDESTKSSRSILYDGTFHDSIDGPGKGQDDSDQVDVVCWYWLFLHNA